MPTISLISRILTALLLMSIVYAEVPSRWRPQWRTRRGLHLRKRAELPKPPTEDVKIEPEPGSLIHAVVSNDFKKVKQLVEAGANLRERDEHGGQSWTAILLATYYGYDDILYYLACKGAARFSQCNHNWYAPLHLVTAGPNNASLKSVLSILHFGGDFTLAQQNNEKQYPLDRAKKYCRGPRCPAIVAVMEDWTKDRDPEPLAEGSMASSSEMNSALTSLVIWMASLTLVLIVRWV